MKFLANENFPYSSIFILRDAGYDIVSIGMENASITDEQVMQIAIRENRTILTFDKDYGELIFRHNYKPKSGVIFFRLHTFSPDLPAKIILDLIATNEFNPSNGLIVIDGEGIFRRRNY